MRLFPLRLFSKNPNIDFMGKRWLGFLFSGTVTLLSIALLATNGLNWGIDFTGGMLMEIRTERPANLADFRPLFPAEEFGEVSLQAFGDQRDVMLRFESKEGADQQQLITQVKEKLATSGYSIEYRKTDFVGPTVGKELVQAGSIATVLAILGILAYVCFRFEWQFGVGGLLALLHDLIATFGFIAITGYEFSMASIAAVLTVLGYSINDSVVLFDRVREMRRKYKKMPLTQMLNEAANATLGRTLLTAGTTLLSLIGLIALGGEGGIREFSSVIFFGILVGTYSSIFISLPVLIYFRLPDERPVSESGKDAPVPLS